MYYYLICLVFMLTCLLYFILFAQLTIVCMKSAKIKCSTSTCRRKTLRPPLANAFFCFSLSFSLHAIPFNHHAKPVCPSFHAPNNIFIYSRISCSKVFACSRMVSRCRWMNGWVVGRLVGESDRCSLVSPSMRAASHFIVYTFVCAPVFAVSLVNSEPR